MLLLLDLLRISIRGTLLDVNFGTLAGDTDEGKREKSSRKTCTQTKEKSVIGTWDVFLQHMYVCIYLCTYIYINKLYICRSRKVIINVGHMAAEVCRVA